MRLLIAFFVFFLALGLSIQSTAEEDAATAAPTEQPCNSVLDDDCKPAEAAAAKPAEKAPVVPIDDNYGHYDELWTKMNTLYPQPRRNRALATAPVQAKIVSPAFLSKIKEANVKLEWSEVPHATSYFLQVATDPNYKWAIVNKHWIKENSYTVTGLEPGKKYFWRVSAVNESLNSTYTKSPFASSIFETAPKK